MDQLVQTKNKTALSGWPIIIGCLAMLIFAFHSSTHMVGAGDTWVALACGRHFINHGVDTVEPFSANSHKAGPTEKNIEAWPSWAKSISDTVGLKTVKYWHPTGWVNQNWLTHVIFYWLTHLSPFADAEEYSFNTLVYWKFAIYIITVICVYYTGRLLGVNPALSALFACFAMFAGRSFLDIRPAGFSNLLVALFLLILVLTTYRNIFYIWLLVPLLVFWCNVHGGYIYAFIMLVPFVALHLLTSFSKKGFVSIGLTGIYHTLAAGFVAFVGMIVFNPFHLTNLTHTFVISLSKHAEMWRTVHEWHPAFEWSNPVGTSFPFLVLYILSIGLTAFWLFSRFCRPKFLKAPKNELEQQKERFINFSKIFACAAAVFAGWVTFIGFSFLNLDILSFLFCTLFIAILLFCIYRNVYFIVLQVPLVLLALWTADSSHGYTGRYIFPFVILPAYVIVHIIASSLSKTIKIKPKNIIFVIIAAVASLLLMELIFDPVNFKLPAWTVKSAEGLSPSLAGWLWAPFDWVGRAIAQFWNIRRPWRPRYEGSNPLSYAGLFGVLLIVNLVSVIIWLAIPHLKTFFTNLSNETDEQPEPQTHELPKIDLALLVIAALTVYMAYKSRRFIPIAAIAACPVVAMFIDQMTRTISAASNFHKNNRLAVPPMPRSLQTFFTIAGAVAVLVFGTWWTLRFKHVYLDRWPTDPILNSVFMRMTASGAKPFYACKFIKDNQLKGKMFNYWTEGGFIAWGQQPDPNTGKTPLQLFMDGRAQAAYEPAAYELWSHIMGGGTIARRLAESAKVRKQPLTKANYKEIGNWISKELRKHNVWAVLMPQREFDKALLRALEHDPDWRLIFFNGKQRLFVDIKTDQAEKLFKGIFTGQTLYPDEFSKSLMMSHILFSKGQAPNRALDLAIKAFQLYPSQVSMRRIILAAKLRELRLPVYKFCKDYFDDFVENKDKFAKEHGYHNRIVAALLAGTYLQNTAKQQKNAELRQFYADKLREFRTERRRFLANQRW